MIQRRVNPICDKSRISGHTRAKLETVGNGNINVQRSVEPKSVLQAFIAQEKREVPKCSSLMSLMSLI